MSKVIGEAKKQEDKKIEASAEEYTEFFSAATTNANSNSGQERLTVDDLAAELQEIQVIEKKTDATAAAAAAVPAAVEMTEKKPATTS